MDHQGQVPATRTDRLLDEGVLPVVEAAAADGIRIGPHGALRWCTAGVRGIRLESLKVAGRRMMSRAAIRRFVAATQPASAVECSRISSGPSPSGGPYLLDDAAAERVLEAYGLGRDQLEAKAKLRNRRGAAEGE